VTFSYDAAGVAFSKGRLTAVSSTVSATNITQYDALGRVMGSTQITGGQTYPFSYAYNVDGTLQQQAYPSGRIVNYGYDGAGRTNNAAAGATTYAFGFTYAPHGALEQMTLGSQNLKIEQTCFNRRLQLTGIRLGTGISGDCSDLGDLLNLSFDYGANNNNGNLLDQTIRVQAGSVQLKQDYRYDGVNRLLFAAEEASNIPGALTCSGVTLSKWCRTYGYDAFGNRLFSEITGTGSGFDPLRPTSIFSSTNRIASGWGYDLAGNLTTDGGGRTYAYDANNKQTAFCPSGGACTVYDYDGNGNRVRKLVNNGAESIFVYDAFGKLAAEYQTTLDANLMAGTFYRTLDHLGSTRLITDQNGADVSRHDYFPFGGEIPSTSGSSRNQVPTYNQPKGIYQKFTGKERDEESKLDYFLARYYSAPMGRFLSVDPGGVGARLGNPQSWNGYAYTLGNPIAYVDPDGESATVAGAVGGAIVGGALALWRGDSVARGAVSGAVAGAIAGSVIDTGGGTAVLLATGALGGAAGGLAGGLTDRVLGGQDTTLENATTDAGVGFVAGGLGAGAGKVITAIGQKLVGPATAFETLRPGPQAGQSVPATGPRVTPSQAAQLKGQPCHTCGKPTTTATTKGNPIGDHQPSTGFVVRSGTQRILPHCRPCSGQQASQVVKQNQIWRQQQRTGAGAGAGAGTGTR